VNPLVAALLMPASSLLVVAGALSVERRVKDSIGTAPQRSPVPETPVGVDRAA